jgi:malate dehydrogenase (quinone)
MSATLAVLLKELDRDQAGSRRADGFRGRGKFNPWNNAGTGHAGLCELNYTPQAADGTVDIKKPCTSTPSSRCRSSSGVPDQERHFGSCKSFISLFTPELRRVTVACRSSRTLQGAEQHHAFASMEYTEDKAKMAEWMPLMMPGRTPAKPRRHPRGRHRRQLRRPDQPVAQAPDQRTDARSSTASVTGLRVTARLDQHQGRQQRQP